MSFIDRPSPNFDERKGDGKVTMLVIHYTGMKSLPEVLDKLADPASKVSAHYVIAEDGTIYKMVDESKRAWHAGVSHWQGEGDVNSRSVGIEVMNNGDRDFTPKQLTALALLSQDIIARHGLRPNNVVGHSDVAPDRKDDPGPYFPWHKFSKINIGHWPEPTLRDKFRAAAAAHKPKELRKLFQKAGYGVDAFGDNKPTIEQLTRAFQSRYEPFVFRDESKSGKPQASTVALLRAVARHNKEIARHNKNALRHKKK